MGKKKKTRRRAYHVGNLREALLKAGAELIEKKGVRALTLREIGKRLGVSRMAAYRHFPDKAALLGAISEIGFARFAEALAKARDAHREHFARLEALGVAYVRFAAENRAHFQVMFGIETEAPELSKEGKAVADRAFATLRETIEAGAKAGAFAVTDVRATTEAAWAIAHGISLLGLEPDATGKAARTRATLKIFSRGLRRG